MGGFSVMWFMLDFWLCGFCVLEEVKCEIGVIGF
jgi:hypothetical protein